MATLFRSPDLNQDFSPIIEPDDFRQFSRDRWPRLSMAVPLVSSLATHGRSDLLDRARTLAATDVNGDGKNGLVTILETVEDVIDFCRAQVEILESVQARLMLVADDLLLEDGHDSVLAEADQSFDPAAWIARATEAGATMFVRGDELWIGSVAGVDQSRQIDRLQLELDSDRRDAVRQVLASRGLRCVEG